MYEIRLNINLENEEKPYTQPGIGVEIVADDVDIHALLEQKNLTKLSLEHLLKYEDHITLPVSIFIVLL